jgi:hypothetical protein
MGMNSQTDVGGVASHFDCQCDFRNQFAGIGTDRCAADYAVCLHVEE